ncbi:MAG: threonylcarbamoyl-AMP synthase [Spirochaetales bacterium]|nr:MAG: threonylcarbamoyl-AMP synthase [Spirochaetales bacterium]
MEELVKIIKSGGVVAFPTETVYGLGADAWNPDAVTAVFNVKGRPSDNPLIVHVAEKNGAYDFATAVPEDAERLMEAFWPGPLTLILIKKPEVLDIVTAGLPSVALRMPNHGLALEFIRRTGPLVGPSANRSGGPSPTTAAHVKDDFGAGFPVLDGGACGIGLESTVLDVTREPYTIYRPGAISADEISAVLRKDVRHLLPGKENFTAVASPSPGLKYTHYAPAAAVRWLDPGESARDPETLYLFHTHGSGSTKNSIHYRGDYTALARELYDRFRQADKQGFTKIAVEPFPEQVQSGGNTIIPALKNRISKAAGL